MRRALVPVVLLALALLAWWAVGAGPPAPPQPTDPGRAEPSRASTVSAPVGAEHERAPADAGSRRIVDDPDPARGHGALTVHVVAALDDAPLPHVAVQVVARDGRADAATRRVVVTDGSGAARFAGLDAGGWAVTTDRSVGGREETAVDVRAGAENEVTIRVPAGVDAIVRVLDAAGGAVPGADVLHWPASGNHDVPAWMPAEVIGSTDAGGELEVRALPHLQGHGSWFAARHAAHGTSVARMVRSPADDADRAPRMVELRLGVQGSWIDLRILDEFGIPISGAVGTARPLDQPSSVDDEQSSVLPQVVRREQTASDGRARLGPLVVGRYLVRVRAAGRAPFREPVQVDGEERVLRDVTLLPEARVHGVVTSAEGDPIAGASVQIQLEPQGGATRTGPDGTFAIGELNAGAATWVVTHDEHQRRTDDVELTAGQDVELAIVLEPLAQLHGRVVDESGAGLEGWSVVASADLPGYADDVRGGSTDADGTFRFAVRGDIDYELDIAEPGQAFPARVLDPVPARAREEPWVVTVPDAAQATAFMEGYLCDRNGVAAITGRTLSVSQQDGRPARVWYGNTAPDPETDPDTGWFRVGPLPSGIYTLSIRCPDALEFHVRDIGLSPRRITNLGRVEEPATGTLEAVLEVEPGVTLGDLLVQIDSANRANGTDIMRILPGTLTRSRRLVPGPYHVTVYGDGFRWLHRDVEVRADETAAIRGVLRAAVKTGLRFHMPDGEDGALFEIRDARGEFVLDVELEAGLTSEDWWPHLDGGRFTVTATGASGREYTTEFTVETLERRETPIDIRVRPAR